MATEVWSVYTSCGHLSRRGQKGTVIDTLDAITGKRRPGTAIRGRNGLCPDCRAQSAAEKAYQQEYQREHPQVHR